MAAQSSYSQTGATSLNAPIETPAVAHDAEQRFLMRGVPWHVYVAFHDGLEAAGAGMRMTYLNGDLELMSPSETHEHFKKIIARLLEAYADEYQIPLDGRGSATFRQELKARGVEPDECYSIGDFKGTPDIAIEVALSRGLVDKLEVYRGLGVAEVWQWHRDTLIVHVLGDSGYTVAERSAKLPQLDLALFTSFVNLDGNQSKHVWAYRAALRLQTK
jgi:Uma2 family endonuclease